MGDVNGRLTVYFEDPFWAGVFERVSEGKLSAAKVTFGAEPREQDVYGFILDHYYDLQFSPAVAAAVKKPAKNPKRIQREVRKQLRETGLGTKSQQALKLQHEQNKQIRKAKSRDKKRTEANRRFELRQQKKKAKHRGH